MTTGCRRMIRRTACAWLVCSWMCGSAFAADPRVQVTCSMNDSGMYVFKVTNKGNSPIVFVELPHYLADQFNTPARWKQETTYLSNIGVPKRPGLCSATAESPIDGIAPGESAQFSLRMGLDGKNESRRGEGSMRIRFADNQSATVDGVSVPVKPPAWENYGLVAGYGAVFALLVLVFSRRRRKNQGAPDAGPPAAAHS